MIILFICDIDEYFYGAYKAASSFWTDGEEDRGMEEEQVAALTERNKLLDEQNVISQQTVEALLEQNKLLLDQNKLLLRKNAPPQDGRTGNGHVGNNNEGNVSVINDESINRGQDESVASHSSSEDGHSLSSSSSRRSRNRGRGRGISR